MEAKKQMDKEQNWNPELPMQTAKRPPFYAVGLSKDPGAVAPVPQEEVKVGLMQENQLKV